MPFKPGKSGNPKGRPCAAVQAKKIRQQILQAAPDVVDALITAARSGDSGAGRALLNTVVPPLKAVELPVALNLPDEGLAGQGRAVIAALAAGQLAPGQAGAILAGLGAVAKLVEADEFEKRIAALESKK